MEAGDFHLWFQCDRYGADTSGVNRFTINFELLEGGAGRNVCRGRFGQGFDVTDGRDWLDLSNLVIARVSEASAVSGQGGEDAASPTNVGGDEALAPLSWVPTDPWLRFTGEDDVKAWWEFFLKPKLEGLIARFIDPPLPEYREFGLPTVRVVWGDRSSTLQVGQRDVVELSVMLTDVLKGVEPGARVQNDGVLILFDAKGFRGGFAQHRWGLKNRPVAWGSFCDAALRQVITALQDPAIRGPEPMSHSPGMSLQVVS
jgi:hypothetical protein